MLIMSNMKLSYFEVLEFTEAVFMAFSNIY